ncbi:glycoside hydrolase family 2 protein [Microbacterium sp. LjRoot45]|uniref:glycoside hydrolase family 2 protein n=1 Tax=Microbacterium sp. LjRoot45 TaxID=3342329 RepID=UPI003ECEF5B1
MITLPLHDGWTFHAAAGSVPADLADTVIHATVPGTVHVDLLREGLIPDPYRGENEALVAWIGKVDWTYQVRFAWSPDGEERHDLVFDGIDTVAEIVLNGVTLGTVANQHRSYRYDVGAHLVDGENALEVRFRAPVPYANAQSLSLGVRPRPYPLPYEAIRKSACNFGWDWGVATFTSGLWKGVRLESWSTARLHEVRVVATPDGEGGHVHLDAQIERAPGATDTELLVHLSVGGLETGVGAVPEVVAAIDGDRVDAHLTLDHVDRWWPVGYGAQPRYDVAVTLTSGQATLDSDARRVGFRDVRWDTDPDDAGTPFTLVVNDQPVYVKGVNWIPDDALPVRVDRDRLSRRLHQALDANLNLIRVWGGGLYESDDFYDLCDELGLLVWQDFLFACAAYPEEEPLRSEIEAEARENVVRIASHPSLVLLTGNNENLWGFEDWAWKERLDGKTWGAYYYYELFPALVRELASHVPYAPGSPFSPGGGWEGPYVTGPDGGRQTGHHPNAEAHGTMHLWEQWNRQDYLTYRDHRPRFVAEFGWQAPPTWTTLTQWLDDDPLTPESPGMVVHQKAMEGNVKLTTGLVPHFRVPEDMETWHWAMQLNQAHAVRCALEWFRALAPHNSGAIVWQLNDCWPVTSWAAIDGEERVKPLFHALAAAFADRVATVQPLGADDAPLAVLGNDTATPWEGVVRARRVRFDGSVIEEQEIPFVVPARGTVRVELSTALTTPGEAGAEALIVDAGTARGSWYFAEPRDSALPAPRLEVETAADPDGTLVTVTARSFARDVTLLVDKVSPDAQADSALHTLLPGESVAIRVRHAGDPLDATALSDARVLRTANELVNA